MHVKKGGWDDVTREKHILNGSPINYAEVVFLLLKIHVRDSPLRCRNTSGFDFADFELGSRAALLAEFPSEEAKPLIEKLTVGLP